MGKIIENYSLQSELGSGVYSRVYKAINMKTKQEVAIKMIKADKFVELPKLEEGTVNEINILSHLEDCPHIIKYFDMLKTVNNFYFVYEFCNGGTLQNLIKKAGFFPEKTALNYFSQIVEAFKILNKFNIMHRDLKPDNLLIHDGILKLADFGFCKPLENQYQTTQTMLGSPIYMAPEILKGQSYTIKADIWSLGVVLFRMLYGFCPFESNNIGKMIMIIEKDDLKIPKNPEVSSITIRLLQRMITKDAKLRADWNEVFSYKIKDGEIVSQINHKTHSSNDYMKDSGSQSTSPYLSNYNYSQSSRQVKSKYQQQKQIRQLDSKYLKPHPNRSQINHNRKYFRNADRFKSPIRQNLKKQILVKNHNKCHQLMSFGVNIAGYEQFEALLISYIICKNIEKQLLSVNQILHKQSQVKMIDDDFVEIFQQILGQQKKQIFKCLKLYQQEIRKQSDISFDMIQIKKKIYLKKFLTSIQLENLEELVTVSRLIDYIEDSILIRRQTYQKISRQQLLRQIKHKISNMADVT